jgi:hypothetical protein
MEYLMVDGERHPKIGDSWDNGDRPKNSYMCPNVHRAGADKPQNEEQVKQEAMMQGLERCHEWDAT